ncbi:hypothetical protein LA080_015888 [Diaporthe eres]|nr:hypothetical protein LA080_015888 [Diaporthe eres]
MSGTMSLLRAMPTTSEKGFLGDLYNHLADSLEIRYNPRSNTRDLEEAVKYASLALSYTPTDHPDLAIRYRGVGVKYTCFYDGDRSLAVFDKAKEALGHAIDLVAQQNPHEDDKAADLQKRLTNLYELQRGDPSYPDKARPPVSESDIVKIAVLDTGNDLDHPKFSRYKTRNKISQEYYKDFVYNDQMARDSSGHGTHCVHTILKHHVNVMNAISSARDQHGVLFFAAATNDAHFKEDSVGFPATMADVIIVNSCSYNGQQSRFSPDSDRNTANALSTLGEEIEAAFPVTLNDGKPLKCLTGTSMATSIMSGIAGLLIEFTKLCGDSSLPKDNVSNMRDQLRTPEGMRELGGIANDIVRAMKTGI